MSKKYEVHALIHKDADAPGVFMHWVKLKTRSNLESATALADIYGDIYKQIKIVTIEEFVIA